jgi:hypothetical protein
MPNPFGAFAPRLCLTTRLTDVLAAMLFLSDGIRNPNFIGASPNIMYYFSVFSLLYQIERMRVIFVTLQSGARY